MEIVIISRMVDWDMYMGIMPIVIYDQSWGSVFLLAHALRHEPGMTRGGGGGGGADPIPS